MLYIEKLKKNEWQTFRIDILIRDNFTCQICNISQVKDKLLINKSNFLNIDSVDLINIKTVALQVHHKCYRLNKEPWEYDSNDLISLCGECHSKIHSETKIPVYDNNENLFSELEVCEKCQGSGWLPHYKHVQEGICFRCYGEGVNIDKLQI